MLYISTDRHLYVCRDINIWMETKMYILIVTGAIYLFRYGPKYLYNI